VQKVSLTVYQSVFNIFEPSMMTRNPHIKYDISCIFPCAKTHLVCEQNIKCDIIKKMK